MPPSEIAALLTELNDTDALVALHAAHSQKSALVLKVDSYPKPIKTFIDNFLDKRAILPKELKEIQLPEDKEISIKFNVGTEVFFIKTFIKSHLNRYYFDMTSKVIHLKRRGEPRYIIPKNFKWKQTGAIVLNESRKAELKCTVLDISQSGLRFEIANCKDAPAFQLDDVIKIKFQIYKRAEIVSTAIVRFILTRPGMPTTIGLEFAGMPDVQKNRIASIIDDIKLFNSLAKN